jgi:hypothetical protein
MSLREPSAQIGQAASSLTKRGKPPASDIAGFPKPDPVECAWCPSAVRKQLSERGNRADPVRGASRRLWARNVRRAEPRAATISLLCSAPGRRTPPGHLSSRNVLDSGPRGQPWGRAWERVVARREAAEADGGPSVQGYRSVTRRTLSRREDRAPLPPPVVYRPFDGVRAGSAVRLG